jgi:hypothetical protein
MTMRDGAVVAIGLLACVVLVDHFVAGSSWTNSLIIGVACAAGGTLGTSIRRASRRSRNVGDKQ